MASENRRFVQFPHPGGEHSPDHGDWKEWNPTRNPHGRKFLEIAGTWLESLDSAKANEGKLWAWAEWEPESRVLRRFAPSGYGPSYLWEPTWLPKESYRGLHNTDPLVFDGFYYSNCKQQSFKGLKQLGRGSVVIFGSRKGSRKSPYWVVDTVFVVSDYVDHADTDYEKRLAGRVPQCFQDAVLSTYGDAGPYGSQRWYRGATYDEPVDGMFSFFPCVPAEIENPFPRPRIELPPAHFTPSLAQGVKGCYLHAAPLDESTLETLWRSIVEQVLGQGLFLGVAAACPARHTPAVLHSGGPEPRGDS